MKSTNKQGYILILTLMLTGLMVTLVTQIFLRGQTYLTYSRTMQEREKANMLALSGIQIALQQLFVAKPQQQQEAAQSGEGAKADAKKPQEDDRLKKAGAKPKSPMVLSLTQTFPYMNQWQTFELKDSTDGMDGQIIIYVTSEEGKLNLNDHYDFAQKRFREKGKTKGALKKALTNMFNSINAAMSADSDGEEMMNGLETWLKDQKSPINDVTQLLRVRGFSIFKDQVYPKPDQERKKRTDEITLTDLFTTWAHFGIDPWVISASWSQVLKLKGAVNDDIATRKEKIKEWVQKATASMQWPESWDKTFKPVYGVGWDMIPKDMQYLFGPRYVPRVFSVIAYGIVGRASQKLIAIVERQGSALLDEPYVIKKIYMI